ncbi:PgaD family protein [Bacillus cereus]|uniref:Poly-beta-1,6-N-acetyl-D-glucosamine biosynthesis protein PgaD n=1 Tax=Bacillus cereus VD184 TaxID=1053242 RepID=A0A9W5R167_BACCE|nr:PgaD family protein [Bacillus cereus]EOQ02073.1 hypothetical protein IKC_04755 [Bacillus cereus VD184]
MGEPRQRFTRKKMIIYYPQPTKVKYIEYFVTTILWVYLLNVFVSILAGLVNWNLEWVEFILFALNTNEGEIQLMLTQIALIAICLSLMFFIWSIIRTVYRQKWSIIKKNALDMDSLLADSFNMNADDIVNFQSQKYITLRK